MTLEKRPEDDREEGTNRMVSFHTQKRLLCPRNRTQQTWPNEEATLQLRGAVNYTVTGRLERTYTIQGSFKHGRQHKTQIYVTMLIDYLKNYYIVS